MFRILHKLQLSCQNNICIEIQDGGCPSWFLKNYCHLFTMWQILTKFHEYVVIWIEKACVTLTSCTWPQFKLAASAILKPIKNTSVMSLTWSITTVQYGKYPLQISVNFLGRINSAVLHVQSGLYTLRARSFYSFKHLSPSVLDEKDQLDSPPFRGKVVSHKHGTWVTWPSLVCLLAPLFPIRNVWLVQPQSHQPAEKAINTPI